MWIKRAEFDKLVEQLDKNTKELQFYKGAHNRLRFEFDEFREKVKPTPTYGMVVTCPQCKRDKMVAVKQGHDYRQEAFDCDVCGLHTDIMHDEYKARPPAHEGRPEI